MSKFRAIISVVLLATPSCSSFMWAPNGAIYAGSMNGGILRQSQSDHRGGVSGALLGSVGSERSLQESDSVTPATVMIGGKDGIVMQGVWTHEPFVRPITGLLRDTARFKTVDRLGEKLIEETAGAAIELGE